MPQTSAMKYIRQGATPFFRLPVVDVEKAVVAVGARRRPGGTTRSESEPVVMILPVVGSTCV